MTSMSRECFQKHLDSLEASPLERHYRQRIVDFHLAVYGDNVTVEGMTRRIYRHGQLLLTIENGNVQFTGNDGTPSETVPLYKAYETRYQLDRCQNPKDLIKVLVNYHGWKKCDDPDDVMIDLLYPPGQDPPFRLNYSIVDNNRYADIQGLVYSMYFYKVHEYVVKREKDAEDPFFRLRCATTPVFAYIANGGTWDELRQEVDD